MRKLIESVGAEISDAWNGWKNFWFSPVPLLNLAVFRIILCADFFFMYLDRQKDLNLFLSDQGILPKELALKALPEFYRPLVVLSFWPDSWLGVVHGLFLLCLALFALGIGGRVVGILCSFFQIAFIQRNYGVAFGADQVGGIFLMYLALTNCCERLSVWNWIKEKFFASKGSFKTESSDVLTSMFYRMVQVHLCVIYVYTGFEKLKGASWWDGTALWSVLANPQMVIADLTWTKNLPLLIVFISFTTILFEVYFPALVANKRTRKYVLMAGVCFHAGIGITMALYTFAIVMLAPYVLFIKKETVQSVLDRLQMLISKQSK